MQLRLRHSKGVATLKAEGEEPIALLQQRVEAISGVSPGKPPHVPDHYFYFLHVELQQFKTGYPPNLRTLDYLVPELPVSTLGLASGDTLILTASLNPAPKAPPPQANSSARADTNVLTPKRTTDSSINRPKHVVTDAGYLVHHVVPDDNSCMFSCIAIAFEQSIAKAAHIRQLVAAGIKADPSKYNEAVLAMPPQSYISTILRPSSWGGAIDLSVLVDHYNTQILSIDVETGRVDTFEPKVPTGQKCILLYSGIHYDTVFLTPDLDAPTEWRQTLFPTATDSDHILQAALELATQLRKERAYTNTSTFDLRCQDCKIGLKGEKDARAHAQATGHVNFGEY